jgi:hypothetical protein
VTQRKISLGDYSHLNVLFLKNHNFAPVLLLDKTDPTTRAIKIRGEASEQQIHEQYTCHFVGQRCQIVYLSHHQHMPLQKLKSIP